MAMKENPHYVAFIDSDEEEENEIEEVEYLAMKEENEGSSNEEEDVDYNLRRSVMKKIVREMTEKISKRKFQITGIAFEILRQEATNQIISLFRCAKKTMDHAKRKTLSPVDMDLILDLKRELCGPAHASSLELKKKSPEDQNNNNGRKSKNSSQSCQYENISIIDSYDLCIEPKEHKRRQTMILKKNGNQIKKPVIKKAKKPRKNNNNNKKQYTEVVESMEVEQQEKKKVSSKKRKLEKEDTNNNDDENEEMERLLKIRREKREELKKKSKQIQEESMALINKYKNDPNEYQYELESELRHC